jgi:hypothetical protein
LKFFKSNDTYVTIIVGWVAFIININMRVCASRSLIIRPKRLEFLIAYGQRSKER